LKDLERTGWIKFQSGTDLEEARKIISEPTTTDFQISDSPHRATRARYTHEIANSEARIRADLDLVKELAKVCDQTLTEVATTESEETQTYDGTALLESRLADHILASEAQEEDEEDASMAAPKIANVVGA
jgi:hypothetical protein